MNTITFAILTALGLWLTYYIVMLVIRIRANVLTGKSFHESLIDQISSLRMGKMMDALGINKEKYIYQESVLDINHHIDTCKTCGNTDQCDEKLDSNNIVVEDLKFCGNESSMVEITFKQKGIG